MDITTYALCKKYIKKTLEGAGALKGDRGLSAYEVAQDNGFTGTEQEWLDSLVGKDGDTPYIGDNGNWFIGDTDTGTKATGTIKVSSEKNSSEIIIDEQNKTISSVIDGTTTVVANYNSTESIEEESILNLFN